MLMSWIVTLLLCLALVCSLLTGRGPELAQGVTEGAAAAVELTLTLAGVMGLWSGVLEVLRRAGVLEALARLLRPLLRLLYPDCSSPTVLRDIAANLSANLLGLGNAATPAGIRAARGLYDGSGRASDSLCTLIVCNTASIQLIPATVAAIRAGAGSPTPFDILPAVWLSSLLSVTVGITAAKLLARIWRC